MEKKFYYLFSCLFLFFYCSNQLLNDSVKDIDGNVYKIVKIGDQWWMAENLKVTHFRNGDEIPNREDDDEWDSGSLAYCNYNNDIANGERYGHLYNWFVVNDSRKIAPEGWHVATDEEWQKLIEFLGGDTMAGGKMKSIGTIDDAGLWKSPNNGATNESGFSAVPGGYRYNHGDFDGIGSTPYFWSSTESNGGNAWHRYLYNGNASIYRDDVGWKQAGYSVRCVKD